MIDEIDNSSVSIAHAFFVCGGRSENRCGNLKLQSDAKRLDDTYQTVVGEVDVVLKRVEILRVHAALQRCCVVSVEEGGDGRGFIRGVRRGRQDDLRLLILEDELVSSSRRELNHYELRCILDEGHVIRFDVGKVLIASDLMGETALHVEKC